jgi:hypothetical protein
MFGLKINPLTENFKSICLVDILAAYLIHKSYRLRIKHVKSVLSYFLSNSSLRVMSFKAGSEEVT